ncbi:putative nuclease HARBI1 [Bemisia tabaci]|uniref:putative nuclease HARBI1 n=1 Tax=Bemisia tabaci TaxID=7038 RepID=UPI003B28A5D2
MLALYDEFVSSSDDEEEYVYIPRRPALRRAQVNYFDLLSEPQFFMRFRLRKETVALLLAQIEPMIRTRTDRNNPITPMNRLLLTLRFFATGCFLVSTGDFIGVSKSSVEVIVWQVSQAIVSLRNQYIKMPTSEEERAVARSEFFDMARFPRCIGAIDCTHVRIQSVGGPTSEIYRNRKGWFSKNVQVIGGPTLLIQDIVCRWPGASHDQTIFNGSSVEQRFEQGDFGTDAIVGDTGYETRSYILTPVTNPNSEAAQLYNESIVRTRQSIERLFGVWKRRFPILSVGIRLRKRTFFKNNFFIVACAILHNIAILNKDEQPPVDPTVIIPQEQTEFDQANPLIVPDPNERNPRYRVRQALINDWFTTLI